MDPIAWLDETLGRRRDRSGVIVSFDDRGYVCRWPGGPIESISWGELLAVVIRTTDRGPVEEDVFLVLRSAGGECVIPQSNLITDDLIVRLQKLPEFNSMAIIQAMRSAENATFVCWEAPGGSRTGGNPTS